MLDRFLSPCPDGGLQVAVAPGDCVAPPRATHEIAWYRLEGAARNRRSQCRNGGPAAPAAFDPGGRAPLSAVRPRQWATDRAHRPAERRARAHYCQATNLAPQTAALTAVRSQRAESLAAAGVSFHVARPRQSPR